MSRVNQYLPAFLPVQFGREVHALLTLKLTNEKGTITISSYQGCLRVLLQTDQGGFQVHAAQNQVLP